MSPSRHTVSIGLSGQHRINQPSGWPCFLQTSSELQGTPIRGTSVVLRGCERIVVVASSHHVVVTSPVSAGSHHYRRFGFRSMSVLTERLNTASGRNRTGSDAKRQRGGDLPATQHNRTALLTLWPPCLCVSNGIGLSWRAGSKTATPRNCGRWHSGSIYFHRSAQQGCCRPLFKTQRHGESQSSH